MQQTFASIITIGDELLIGQVIDTNSAFIARQMNSIGISIKNRIAVGDVWTDIWQTLDETARTSAVVLITGGLGPTADDITKPLLCKYFDGKMVTSQAALDNVVSIFTKLGRPMIDRNLLQAEVPDTCTVINNTRGTAPGMWFEKKGVIFISMPGVPFEMQGMVTDYVLPELQQRLQLPFILHKTLVTFGIGESFLANLIQNWEEALPQNIKLAYLPNYGMVRLRLSAFGAQKATLEQLIDAEFEKLKLIVKEYLVTDQDETMEMTVARLLLQRNETMSTAESCTGGYIAHLITAMAGSSAYYHGSVVSYSYEAKEDILGVDHELLVQNGAVSEEVVLQMVAGALKQLKTTYAIAVSGIMGPGGAIGDKPVGTVWVAVGNQQHRITQKFHFRFDRKRNIELTAMNALNLLRKFIIDNA